MGQTLVSGTAGGALTSPASADAAHRHTLLLTREELLHLQDALDDYASDNCNRRPPSVVRFLQRQLHGLTGEGLPPWFHEKAAR